MTAFSTWGGSQIYMDANIYTVCSRFQKDLQRVWRQWLRSLYLKTTCRVDERTSWRIFCTWRGSHVCVLCQRTTRSTSLRCGFDLKPTVCGRFRHPYKGDRSAGAMQKDETTCSRRCVRVTYNSIQTLTMNRQCSQPKSTQEAAHQARL